MPFYDGIEVYRPNGYVGVDDNSRYVMRDGECLCVEFYPWPLKRPHLAVLYAWDVLSWHIAVIRQHGWREWKHLRSF
jgi:hypothetical protein